MHNINLCQYLFQTTVGNVCCFDCALFRKKNLYYLGSKMKGEAVGVPMPIFPEEGPFQSVGEETPDHRPCSIWEWGSGLLGFVEGFCMMWHRSNFYSVGGKKWLR